MGFRQDGPHNLPFIYPPLTDSRERRGGEERREGCKRREREQRRGEEDREIGGEWDGRTG